jgi:hypothetical protein
MFKGNTTYFRENAARCLRLADGLSLNNPSRVQLLELAQDFNRQAQELEAANTRRDETSGSNEGSDPAKPNVSY